MNEQCVDEYIQYVKEIYDKDVEFVSSEDIVDSKTKNLSDKCLFLIYKEDVEELNKLLNHNLPYTSRVKYDHWNDPNSFPILMHSDFDVFDNEVYTGWMNFSPTDEFKAGETDIGKKSLQWYYDSDYHFNHFYVLKDHKLQIFDLNEMI